jgi:hypothetical protein
MNRYTDIDNIETQEGRQYKRTTIYPAIPVSEDDIYIITTIEDRYDTLSLQFYNDASLWWIIASANNSERASLIVQPGVQLRIPASKSQAVELFNRENTIR